MEGGGVMADWKHAMRVLRTDVDGKLRQTRVLLAQHAVGDLDIGSESKAQLQGEALAYAGVLDLIDVTTMMHIASDSKA